LYKAHSEERGGGRERKTERVTERGEGEGESEGEGEGEQTDIDCN